MRRVGDVLFVTGMSVFFLGLSGYDSNPVECAIAAVIALVIAYIGYQISDDVVVYRDEDILDAQSIMEEEYRRSAGGDRDRW